MRPRLNDTNRQRRLAEYKPLESTREARAMKYHEDVQRQWQRTGARLAKLTGRDPSTLSMFSEDDFRRTNEERFLIAQVVNTLAKKEQGVWNPLPRIGDLFAQIERPNLERFEVIRNPQQEKGVAGARPTSFFSSKYYKKRVKQLRAFIEKIKPFEPDTDGLEVVGHTPDFMKQIQLLPEVKETPEETFQENYADQKEKRTSTCTCAFDTNRLFFVTQPGVTMAKSVRVANEGTCAIYYHWDLARDVDMTIGSGATREQVRKNTNENFDWRDSEAFDTAKNMNDKSRPEFVFTQISGSILPGNTVTFSFTFKSDVPGCFLQKWIMRTTPNMDSPVQTSVSLRGCCQVEPPDIPSFKSMINTSLHESERARCIEEIMTSILDRVKKIAELRGKLGEERIDGDILIDDRAPVFEEANKKWGLSYSPGLFSALQQFAEKVWDALGIEGFERFWDLSIDSLNELAMKVEDGQLKRSLILQLNQILEQNMSSSSIGNLSYSIAYLQLSYGADNLQQTADDFNLAQFVIPKLPDPAELEEQLETSRKRTRGGRARKPPPKRGRKGKGQEEEPPAPETLHAELTDELRAVLKKKVKRFLVQRIRTFERLCGESNGVTQQLTNVNEMEKLDTNLDLEVDDDLDEEVDE